MLCGGAAFDLLMMVKNANFTARIGAFDVLRCRDCGLAHMEPWPSEADLRELYVAQSVFSGPRAGPPPGYCPDNAFERIYRRFGSDDAFIVKNCLSLATRRARRKVLDVGCSTGRTLAGFRKFVAGAELYGIDVDPRAKANAPEWLAERIHIGDFLTHDFGHRFDIITMKFVLEHLLDMRAYVERATEFLTDGGLLFLSTPDIDSAKAREQRERWHSVNDPSIRTGHALWFNRRAIGRLADECGLCIARCTHRGEVFYHLPGWARRTLVAALGVEPTTGRPVRSYRLRMLYASLFDGVVSEWLDYGDSLYAFMVKEPRSATAVQAT